MLPNDERDYRHNVLRALRGICDALEKMARDGLVIRVVNENGRKDEKESNHKEG
ncbi:MAG: hypothetical protein IJL80_06075 [Treponema sp.]|nr:hypothetical protein [Treponema sp.]